MVTYIHTDAQGSVVAKRDAHGSVIKCYDYEPYGALVGGAGHGWVGVFRACERFGCRTKYRQQRYMDPLEGAFLSVDPITANEQPVGQFNRYAAYKLAVCG